MCDFFMNLDDFFVVVCTGFHEGCGFHQICSLYALVLGLHLVHLILNLYSDIFYDFILGQSVLATCILAQKHILHISRGKV